jgi:hypothetical protein
MGSALEIEVIRGDNFSVIAKGDTRNLSDLIAEERNGKLEIRYRTTRNRRYSTRIFITMPDFQEADFSGASQISIIGFYSEPEVRIKLSGASNANISLEANTLHLDLSGASQVRLYSGFSNNLNVFLSGASTLRAFDFSAQRADLRLSGASVAEVLVLQSLRVDASGGSTVRYRGEPLVEQILSGGSRVIKN